MTNYYKKIPKNKISVIYAKKNPLQSTDLSTYATLLEIMLFQHYSNHKSPTWT